MEPLDSDSSFTPEVVVSHADYSVSIWLLKGQSDTATLQSWLRDAKARGVTFSEINRRPRWPLCLISIKRSTIGERVIVDGLGPDIPRLCLAHMAGLVAIGAGRRLISLDLDSCHKLWDVSMEYPLHRIDPVGENSAVATTELGMIRLERDGRIRWEYTHNDPIEEVQISRGIAQLRDIGGGMAHVDLETGELKSEGKIAH